MLSVRLATAGPSLNPVSDLNQLTAYPFMDHALEAGTIVAVTSGLIGWFMVLRRQTFAGHTLSVMAFPGAAGALLVGLSASVGFFVFSGLAALAIGAARPTRSRGDRGQESAVTGTVQAFGLACGFLFLSLYQGVLGSYETLLFASVDEGVARARGVPTRALGVGFLLLLGMAVAETAQITGALLVFALLVAPPATAQLLTARTGLGLALSVLLGVVTVWLGLALAYFYEYPVGFYITTVAFVMYVLARLLRTALDAPRRLPGGAPAATPATAEGGG